MKKLNITLGLLLLSSLLNGEEIKKESKQPIVGIDIHTFHQEERARKKGANGLIKVGMDTIMYESSLEDKNRVEPYIGFEVFPIKNSNFYLDGKTSLRHEYTSSEKRYNKTMVELYAGSVYRHEKLFLNYKIGIRHDELKNTKVQRGTTFRFIPKATYDFTNNLGWYLKGSVGYADVKGDDRDQVTKDYNLPFEESGYVNRIETGLGYRINNTKFSLGIVNKSKEEYAGEYIPWTYIAKLDHNLYADKHIQIRPYIWGFLNPEIETGPTNKKEKFQNELGVMVGTRVTWNAKRDLSFTADVVYLAQHKNESGEGSGSGTGSNNSRKGGNGSGGGTGGGGSNPGSGSGNGSGNGSGSGSGSGSFTRSIEESVIIRLGFKKYF